MPFLETINENPGLKESLITVLNGSGSLSRMFEEGKRHLIAFLLGFFQHALRHTKEKPV